MAAPRSRMLAAMRGGALLGVVLALSASGASAAASGPGERALGTVRALASLGPRVAGSPAERGGARLVAARLRTLGYAISMQTFELPRGGRSLNVVGRTPGPVRVVVVAHVDSVHEGVGANDNASGVAVLLEVARALGEREGVLVAAVGAEERVETGSPVHLGSTRLVAGLRPAERRGIRLALALDMVGVGTRLHVRGLEQRPNRSARIVLANARGATYLRDSGSSDHGELTRAGIPAAWLEWRKDGCWHTACDRARRVRPGRLAAAFRAAVRAALDALA